MKKFSRDWDDHTVSGLTRDVAFNRNSFDNEAITSPSDNNTVQVGTDGIVVSLLQGINEGDFKRTLSRAVNATLGVDISSPPAEADWEEMLEGGLQTALETQVIVFEVSGVSRACTHQLVRSRRASFHQQSMRAHSYGEHPEARMPESIWNNPAAREAFNWATAEAHYAYRVAIDNDVSYQDARFILPEATTNYILLEYPVREFLNVYAYRACSMFQWEIVQVMRECKRVLVEAHPWIEQYVKISCETTRPVSALDKDGVIHRYAHSCTFQGWEQVEGQCDFPWAEEGNRTFKSKLHQIGRRKESRGDA